MLKFVGGIPSKSNKSLQETSTKVPTFSILQDLHLKFSTGGFFT
jgi:hypothetical protein